jgi:hypothetical protein
MILYRPVGIQELELIAENGFSGFPPRLPFQPIFYPVLTREYAEQIAGDWNTSDPASGYAGFVLKFHFEEEYARSFPIQTVGAAHHQELWVPAAELETFNRHIQGLIAIEAAYYGPDFRGEKWVY